MPKPRVTFCHISGNNKDDSNQVSERVKSQQNDDQNSVIVNTKKFLDLNNLLEELDRQHFGRRFSDCRIQLVWSDNMQKRKSQTNKNKILKSATIFFSRKLLGHCSANELKSFMKNQLIKLYSDFGFDKLDALQEIEDIQKKLNNCSISEKKSGREVKFKMDDKIRQIELKNIVDEKLEKIDPMPDIQILLKEYNERFFNGTLNPNEVEICWGDKLQKTAGITVPHNGQPIQIRLSRKLLLANERRHLVETLLHEMIHAYILINDFDEKGKSHGQHFHCLMDNINKKSGANITVHHDMEFDERKFLEKCAKYRQERNKRQHHKKQSEE